MPLLRHNPQRLILPGRRREANAGLHNLRRLAVSTRPKRLLLCPPPSLQDLLETRVFTQFTPGLASTGCQSTWDRSSRPRAERYGSHRPATRPREPRWRGKQVRQTGETNSRFARDRSSAYSAQNRCAAPDGRSLMAPTAGAVIRVGMWIINRVEF